jgi:DNA-binding MarR family transcriptional regulator
VDLVMFSLKRAHHSAVRVTRGPAATWGLTPARFDMMHALSRCPYGASQSWLRQALGVSRATVSRMLKSLEELGLLTRRRCDEDRRTRWIELTEEGRARIEGARADLIGSGAIELVVRTCVASERWHDPIVCARQKEALVSLLLRFRVALGDFGFSYMSGWRDPPRDAQGLDLLVERGRVAKRYRKPKRRPASRRAAA